VRFTRSLIKAAFRARFDAYPDWKIDAYENAWRLAASAFDQTNPSRTDFDALYAELKGYWQVFRNLRGGTALSAKAAYDLLGGLPPEAKRLRLSKLTAGHDALLRQVIGAAKKIKTGKGGVSLMAMSKFLHFWNPKLFVIVDRWAVADNVFRRLWIRRTLPADFAADADHYAELLQWAAGVLRGNPAIVKEFAAYTRSAAQPKKLPSGWYRYEATAVEWFLEGVVEMPPCGVS